jgi:hypothetical protein
MRLAAALVSAISVLIASCGTSSGSNPDDNSGSGGSSDNVGGGSPSSGGSSGNGVGGSVGTGGAGNGNDASTNNMMDGSVGNASGVPTIPVGLDAYRMWDRLADVRIGMRAYMRSTYDRSGGNEGADASHFLRQTDEDHNVTVDTVGPGVLYFVRTNHWHGSPWHYMVDGNDLVVQESSTATPNAPVNNSTFLPKEAFPSPLAVTWSATKGADLSWVPVPFTKSMTLAYGRTHYGTGYYIYDLFPQGAGNLSQPIAAFDGKTAPTQDVLDLFGKAGTDIAPTGAALTVTESMADVAASATQVIADLKTGPAQVRALVLRAPKAQALALGRAKLRITWDDAAAPSIDVPVALFFGAGTLYNRTNAEYLVKGLFAGVHFDATDVQLAAYWPMPFFHHAHIELVAGADAVPGLRWHIRTEPYTRPTNQAGYFHATFVDHGTPVNGQDLVVLDTTKTEGGGPFCGSFVGMSWIFSDNAQLGTLEGDPRFFFDDSESPQAQGTGTEEWGGGGDYWGGQNMTLPLAGHPTGSPDAASAKDPEDKIESAYRFLLADMMPFGRNARIQLEHGGNDDSTEHYRTVAYWYGLPGGCLTLSDQLHVSDTADEQAHTYTSATATAVDMLTSRFELGPQAPDVMDTGRQMKGDTEFSMKLDPSNKGAMLRRRLDYQYPDQRAEVYVADGAAGTKFDLAGIWYLAGSNRCVYSNPAAELAPAAHTVETSTRRFREDEFLIPRSLTEGRSAIRLRIHFTPVNTPLFTGDTPPVQPAWSEFRYWLYSYVMPPLPK